MPTLVSALQLSANPFEHYTAETEPDIAEYAVKPPYLTAISARASATSSYILFGDRGAGKSATRITLFQELWAKKAADKPGAPGSPLAVNYIDFTGAVENYKRKSFSESDFVNEVAYLVIEMLLGWLSSLEEDDREVFTQLPDKDENALIVALLRAFYLSRGEMQRQQSERSALTLLNQAWTTKSALWISKRWDKISALGGIIVDLFTKKYVAEGADVSDRVEKLIRSFSGQSEYSGRVVLEKLVDFVKIFGFSGIVVLIDKVDETEVTNNSAEATTQLVYPLLSHIQLLEVPGFAWQLFLWSQVKPFMEGEQYTVRLDKIASSSISWDVPFFSQMLDSRIRFFSKGQKDFSALFEPGTAVPDVVAQLVRTSMRSPRELIRLMDIIVTEHDITCADQTEVALLTLESIEAGQDKYVKERIDSIYSERTLGQIYRLESLRFTNKDVQGKFRINSQSARNKIKVWEDAGLVKQTGTRAAEGDLGGKPSYEYSIIDARVERIISKGLVEISDLPEDSASYEEDSAGA